MAHLTIEHSANLADQVDIGGLVETLHDAALATDVVRVDALRTRAAAREHYAVGDRAPGNTFVAVVARLGPGRPPGDKHALIDGVLVALEKYLGDAAATCMVSVECQEIDAEFRVNRNHLRPLIHDRAAR